jgi:hypothetical protein
MHPNYLAIIGLCLIALAILINLAHIVRARRHFRERVRRDNILVGIRYAR